ncbi:MAG TPA: hypothetical protein VFH22_11165 [Rhodocyclaceae bacterium]|nr:hypothetical protein [Rhodocyclaceae bacterium]
MNQTLLEQVARLKVRLRQDAGLSLNTRRFFEEADYGEEMLERAEDSDDIEVVKLAMELRHRMGWLPQIAPAPLPLPARQALPDPHAARPKAGRYLYGARS